MSSLGDLALDLEVQQISVAQIIGTLCSHDVYLPDRLPVKLKSYSFNKIQPSDPLVCMSSASLFKNSQQLDTPYDIMNDSQVVFGV